MKIILMSFTVACFMLLFASCNDKIDVQKAYDFTLLHWFLQDKIKKGETVEIRFNLKRSGKYDGTEFYIGYIQRKGKGEVFDTEERYLINREQIELKALPDLHENEKGELVFTLFYRCLSDQKSDLQFVITDNFSQERTQTIAFEADTQKDE